MNAERFPETFYTGLFAAPAGMLSAVAVRNTALHSSTYGASASALARRGLHFSAELSGLAACRRAQLLIDQFSKWAVLACPGKVAPGHKTPDQTNVNPVAYNSTTEGI